jgi:hypothetical protein
MKAFVLFAAFGLALNVVAHANNRVILFGGNDHFEAGENIYLDGMTQLTAGYRAHGWQVRPLYDGSAARCSRLATDPACLKRPLPTDCCPPNTTPSSVNVGPIAAAAGVDSREVPGASKAALLSQLQAALNELPAKSQLLLHIYTHGGDGDFTVSDASSSRYSDPEILSYLDRLQAKGVKLGFVVDSCFSGSAIPVWKKYGCVITAASANHTSIAKESISWASTDGSSGVKRVPGPFAETMISMLQANPKSNKAVSLNQLFAAVLIQEGRRCEEDTPQISSFDIASPEQLEQMPPQASPLAFGPGSCPPADSLPISMKKQQDFESYIRSLSIYPPTMYQDYQAGIIAYVKAKRDLDAANAAIDQLFRENRTGSIPMKFKLTGILKELGSDIEKSFPDLRLFSDGTFGREISILDQLNFRRSGLDKGKARKDALEFASKIVNKLPSARKSDFHLGTVQESLADSILDGWKDLDEQLEHSPLASKLEEVQARHSSAYLKYESLQHNARCLLHALRSRMFAEQLMNAVSEKPARPDPCEDFSLAN